MSKNTVLIRPNCSEGYNDSIQHLRCIEPPLWLAIMANRYKKPIIVDAELEGLNEEQTIEKAMSFNPEKIIILSTGSHPSAHIQQKDIVDSLVNKIEIEAEGYSYLPFNPITTGTPRWDLVPILSYRAHSWQCFGGLHRQPYGVLYTSIGCPYKCEFCCVNSFYNSEFKIRPIEDIIYDAYTMANYGIHNIKIMDELFISNKKRTIEICQKLAKIHEKYNFNIWAYARIDIMDDELLKNLKMAGINWLAYGIETGNNVIRKEVLKGSFNNNRIKDVIKMTKDNGINVLGNYMFGFWKDDLNTMNETLQLAIDLNSEYSNFYCTVAYPESKLYEEMKLKDVDLATSSKEYAQLGKFFKPLSTKYLSNKEVLKFRDEAFTLYNSNPYYLKMITEKFGIETCREITDMNNIELERNLLNENYNRGTE